MLISAKRRYSVLIHALVLCAVMAIAGGVMAQDATVTLPAATATTGNFSGTNFVLVSQTVPAGYMQLFKAYDGSYRNPVVVIEGFDPQNTTKPTSFYDTLNTTGVLDDARASGRSIWIINFGDGGGAITANAIQVSYAINTAANWGGLTSAKVDVVGVSMGGIVGRWALAYDEQYGGGSDGLVRLFISADSPQQGANGPVSLQELLLAQSDPVLSALLACPAARSMSYQTVLQNQNKYCGLPLGTNYVASSAAHDWFYNTANALNGDGYPHKCRNVAFANGSMTAQPHNVGDAIYQARLYATIFGTRINICTENYPAQPMDVAAGSLGTDYAPGNLRTDALELDEYFVFTFIPTASALDLRSGLSKFDRAMYQTTAQAHKTITTDTTDFILDEVMGSDRRYNPKYLPNNTQANIYDWIVTAVFPGLFYIESPDRLFGIGVSSSQSVVPGQVVTVRGTMTTTSGERGIAPTSVSVTSSTNPLQPWGMSNRSLGGRAVGPYTSGIYGATSPSNVGLRVRVWGRVTYADPVSGYFYIDDGSGASDISRAGVKVMGTVPVGQGQDPIGRFVEVTGISSCFQSVYLYRLVRATDVVLVQ